MTSNKPVRVTILIGYRLADPLPGAVEMAKLAAVGFKQSGLDVDLRVDAATLPNLKREARRGGDVLLYYGHGGDDGTLSFQDMDISFPDISALPDVASFFQSLQGCMVFACYGAKFAERLSCPWLAFSAPILTTAPKGFMTSLMNHLSRHDLRAAISEARADTQRSMRSSFDESMQLSTTPWPDLTFKSGQSRTTCSSPAITLRFRTAFEAVELGDHVYPDHDPFVGRVADLENLLDLPSPHDDRPLQRVVWVFGEAGIGKSALLREFAILVRDLGFREEPDAIFLLHIYCYQDTRPAQVISRLCNEAAILYSLPSVPTTLDDLGRALEPLGGTHVWVLDDLTYLSVKPDANQDAATLVRSITDCARVHGLRMQVVVSSRRRPVSEAESIGVQPLTPDEAVGLAVRVRNLVDAPTSPMDAGVDIIALFNGVMRSTAAFKRALLLAAELRISLNETAQRMLRVDALEMQDAIHQTRRSIEWELSALGALEEAHGFAYTRFLGSLHAIVRRAGFFSTEELSLWFGDSLVAGAARRAREATTYQNGIFYLVRLGFLMAENRGGQRVFTVPPNQRWNMCALDVMVPLPGQVPRRGAEARLSLALERIARDEPEGLVDLLGMEHDFANDVDDPTSATAAAYAKTIRAAIAGHRHGPMAAVAILDELIGDYRSGGALARGGAKAEEPVAKAMFDKGTFLVNAGELERGIAAYDDLVEQFAGRSEPELCEPVARGLLNRGLALVEKGDLEAGLASFDQIVSKYANNELPLINEQIGKALYNKGNAHLARGDNEMALASYERLLERFGTKAAMSLQLETLVAATLFNRGISLGRLQRGDEAVSSYDQIEERYGERREAELLKEVAQALWDKGRYLAHVKRFGEAIRAYQGVIDRCWSRTEIALEVYAAKAMFLKGLAQRDEGNLAGAFEAWAAVVNRYADRAEADLQTEVRRAVAATRDALSRGSSTLP